MKWILILFGILNVCFAQSFNGIEASDQESVNSVSAEDIASIGGVEFSYYANIKYFAPDGTDEYLSFTDIDFGTTYSMSVWFSRSTGNAAIIGHDAAAGARVNHVAGTNIFMNATDAEEGKSFSWAENTSVHHLVWTRTGGTFTAYLDNAAQSISGTELSFPEYGFTLKYIGRIATTYITGTIDELVIYSSVLNSTQVATLYGGGTAATCGNPKSISGRVFYANFEQAYNALTAETDDAGTTINLTQQNCESDDIVSY